MTKWLQSKNTTPRRHAHKALAGVKNGHITKNAVRRLARRAGVKRMSADVPTEARAALRAFLHDILRDVVIITEHSRRQTASVMDILLALKRNGRQLYGFGVPLSLGWGATDSLKGRKRTLQEANAEEEAFRQTAAHSPAAAAPAARLAKEALCTPSGCKAPAEKRSAEDATGDLPQKDAELAPETPEAGLSEDHAWRIRKALGAFSVSPAARQLTIACKIPEVHAQLQPFLGTTPCTVAQLRAVARRLSDDDSIEVYFDPTEDRVILS